MSDYELDYVALFTGELVKYNKFDMEFAISHDKDLAEPVIRRLTAYNETYKVVRPLIRFYWGKIIYLIDNPDIIIDFIRKENPDLLDVEGAEEYIKRQIHKIGYALYDYIQPSAKVQVKLDKKARKFKEKMDKKKDKEDN